MARPPRLAVAGELHYLLLRGHNRQSAFDDDRDRETFLTLLREAAAQHGVKAHAYVLLDTEVHLLLTPQEATSHSRLMQSLGRRYVAWFNRRHGRSGTLWEGRFRACAIDGATLGLDAMVYVETLPSTAGLVGGADEWRWSSAAHHIGRRRDPLLSDHPCYWALGNTPFERELAHARRLKEGISADLAQRFATAVVQGRPLGAAQFLATLQAQTGRSWQARPRGRPRGAGAAVKPGTS